MTCGIYKIANKINNKVYIGQSVNIERRFNQHKNGNEQKVDKAIQKYGVENFSFEIIETCLPEELNDKEEYWTRYFNSHKTGYNCGIVKSLGIGEQNSMAKLTEKDVFVIRECYKNKTFDSCAELHRNLFPNIGYSAIYAVFYGISWTHIFMDVYTKELEEYYQKISKQQNNFKTGENNISAVLTEEEVIEIRSLYTVKQQKELYEIFDYLKERTIKSIISGQNWKHLPIYKKREKKWSFPEEYSMEDKVNFINKVKEILEQYDL